MEMRQQEGSPGHSTDVPQCRHHDLSAPQDIAAHTADSGRQPPEPLPQLSPRVTHCCQYFNLISTSRSWIGGALLHACCMGAKVAESTFSSFCVAKPHLTHEGYVKHAVQAANGTSSYCGGQNPSGGISAELPGTPSPGKLVSHEFCPLYFRQPPVTLPSFRAPYEMLSSLKVGQSACLLLPPDLSEHGRQEAGNRASIKTQMPHLFCSLWSLQAPTPGRAVWADPRYQGVVRWGPCLLAQVCS